MADAKRALPQASQITGFTLNGFPRIDPIRLFLPNKLNLLEAAIASDTAFAQFIAKHVTTHSSLAGYTRYDVMLELAVWYQSQALSSAAETCFKLAQQDPNHSSAAYISADASITAEPYFKLAQQHRDHSSAAYISAKANITKAVAGITPSMQQQHLHALCARYEYQATTSPTEYITLIAIRNSVCEVKSVDRFAEQHTPQFVSLALGYNSSAAFTTLSEADPINLDESKIDLSATTTKKDTRTDRFPLVCNAVLLSSPDSKNLLGIGIRKCFFNPTVLAPLRNQYCLALIKAYLREINIDRWQESPALQPLFERTPTLAMLLAKPTLELLQFLDRDLTFLISPNQTLREITATLVMPILNAKYFANLKLNNPQLINHLQANMAIALADAGNMEAALALCANLKPEHLTPYQNLRLGKLLSSGPAEGYEQAIQHLLLAYSGTSGSPNRIMSISAATLSASSSACASSAATSAFSGSSAQMAIYLPISLRELEIDIAILEKKITYLNTLKTKEAAAELEICNGQLRALNQLLQKVMQFEALRAIYHTSCLSSKEGRALLSEVDATIEFPPLPSARTLTPSDVSSLVMASLTEGRPKQEGEEGKDAKSPEARLKQEAAEGEGNPSPRLGGAKGGDG